MKQELSHGGIFGQADGAVVGVCGLTSLPEALQEVSANRPVRLIMGHGLRVNRFENGESCCRSVCFRKRGGVSGSCAERRRYPEQLFVEQHDCCPVGPTGARALRMHGLDGSFNLKSSDAAMLESLRQMVFRLLY